MQEMFASAKRPFYQSSQLLTIEAINRDMYADFAIKHFADNNLRLSCEVFDRFMGEWLRNQMF